MNKKLKCTLCTIMIFTFIVGTFGVYAKVTPSKAKIVRIELNGEIIPFDSELTIVNGRILVPMSFFEKLSAGVKWDTEKQLISINDYYTTIELKIDSNIANIYRKYDFTGIPEKEKLDVVPIIVNDEIVVPLRFVSEKLGAIVGWDNTNRKAVIEFQEVDIAGKLLYKVVNEGDIINDELNKWFLENYKNKGIYNIISNEKTYVLICAGEKTTGGYSMNIENVKIDKNGNVNISTKLDKPEQGAMVIQALTYPNITIELDSKSIRSIYGNIAE